MNSLKYYRGTGYGKINKLLRENTIPTGKSLENLIKSAKESSEYDTLNHINSIDQILAKNSRYDGKILYRGIRGVSNANVGDVITHRNFLSTSLFLESAKKFQDDEIKCCIIYFKLPANFKLFKYTDKDSAKNVEGEILIERNTQFIIKEIIGKKYFAELRKYKITSGSGPSKEISKVISIVMSKELLGNLKESIDSFIEELKDFDDYSGKTNSELVSEFLLAFPHYKEHKKNVKELFKKKTITNKT